MGKKKGGGHTTTITSVTSADASRSSRSSAMVYGVESETLKCLPVVRKSGETRTQWIDRLVAYTTTHSATMSDEQRRLIEELRRGRSYSVMAASCCHWRPAKTSDANSHTVALSDSRGRCLLHLLAQYDFIAYLGYIFWRKMIIMLPTIIDSGYSEDRELLEKNRPCLRGGAIHTPVHGGMTGALSSVPRLLPSNVFLESRHVLTRGSFQGFGNEDDFACYLKWLVLCNQVDVLSLLIQEVGVDVNDRWNEHRDGTLLHIASDAGMTRLLLARGANIESTAYGGATPAHAAAYDGRAEVLRVLLARGANTEVKDSYGWTALMYAARDNRLDVLQLLLAHGADTAAESWGGTPAHLAAQNNNVDCMKALQAAGAEQRSVSVLQNWATDPKRTDETPLDLAVQKGHTDGGAVEGRPW